MIEPTETSITIEIKAAQVRNTGWNGPPRTDLNGGTPMMWADAQIWVEVKESLKLMLTIGVSCGDNWA